MGEKPPLEMSANYCRIMRANICIRKSEKRRHLAPWHPEQF
jgi:hypothetical protein